MSRPGQGVQGFQRLGRIASLNWSRVIPPSSATSCSTSTITGNLRQQLRTLNEVAIRPSCKPTTLGRYHKEPVNEGVSRLTIKRTLAACPGNPAGGSLRFTLQPRPGDLSRGTGTRGSNLLPEQPDNNGKGDVNVPPQALPRTKLGVAFIHGYTPSPRNTKATSYPHANTTASSGSNPEPSQRRKAQERGPE